MTPVCPLRVAPRVSPPYGFGAMIIELGEVEHALCEVEGVHQACIDVRNDGVGESRLVAYWLASDPAAADAGFKESLSRTLPDYMVVRSGDVVSGSWFDLTLQFLEKEAHASQIGTAAIVKRLTEIIFIQVINAWLEHEQPKHGLLAALFDRRLGHSLKAIHRNPAQRWTIAALAKEAGMAYATVAMVTDYDCWKEEHCTVEEIMKVMGQNYKSAATLLESLIPSLHSNPIEVNPENPRGTY